MKTKFFYLVFLLLARDLIFVNIVHSTSIKSFIEGSTPVKFYHKNAVPGESYYFHIYDTPGKDDVDVEYIMGNLPIIISVPHGGDLMPKECKTRRGLPWKVVTCKDMYTVPLALKIKNQIIKETGKYPHIVICRLHRKKIDMNRDWDSNWDDDDIRVQTAWKDFHSFLDIAKGKAIEDYETGFLIDLHGQPKERTMVGYGLSGSKLKKDAEEIEKMANSSSLRYLFNNYNKSKCSFTDLIRGVNSIGSLIESSCSNLEDDTGDEYYLCVPSSSMVKPVGNYFGGAYNLKRHCGLLDEFQDSFPEISGIQLECSPNLRKHHQDKFSKGMTKALIKFLNVHYDMNIVNFIEGPKNIRSTSGISKDQIIIQWDETREATYYKIYRANYPEGPYSQIDGSGDLLLTTYEDTGLINCREYYYRVKAFGNTMETNYSDYTMGSLYCSEITLLEDRFEGIPWNKNWSGDWIIEEDNQHNTSAKADKIHSGQFTSCDLNASDAIEIRVDFYFKKIFTEKDDFSLYYYNGDEYIGIADMNDEGDDKEWVHFTHIITDSQFFVSNFRIQFKAQDLYGGNWFGYKKEKVWIDDVKIIMTMQLD